MFLHLRWTAQTTNKHCAAAGAAGWLASSQYGKSQHGKSPRDSGCGSCHRSTPIEGQDPHRGAGPPSRGRAPLEGRGRSAAPTGAPGAAPEATAGTVDAATPS